MKLSELLLNRWLYKDNTQSLETKDSTAVSLDSNTPDPAAIPSGGAAQDINTGNVTINGEQITPGTIPQSVLDIANWGWGQTSAFSSASATQVNWGAGTFKSASGDTYSISSGNTGTMAAKTYIYFDVVASETTYQVTTTPGDAVGIGKVLVAVAQNGATSATFNLNEATQIVGDNILANTINATKMNVGQLSAISADLGSITAGTVTGALLQTAASGSRVEIKGSTNEINIYDASTRRARGYQSGWSFYNTSGTTVADIYAGTTALGANSLLLTASATATGSLYLNAGSSGTVGLFIDGTSYLQASGNSAEVLLAKDMMPVGSVRLGDLGSEFTHIWADTAIFTDVTAQGDLTVNSGGSISLNGTAITDWSDISGVSDLSGLTIDTTKNWAGYGITNLDHLSFNGAGSYIEDVSAVYLAGRSSNPSSPEGSIWFYSSGGTYEIRTYIGGNRYRFNLTAV